MEFLQIPFTFPSFSTKENIKKTLEILHVFFPVLYSREPYSEKKVKIYFGGILIQ